MSYKILEPINTFDLLMSYKSLEDKIQWTDFYHKGRQVGLQYKDGEDVWNSSVDKSRGEELKFDKLNPFFKNTPFEKIIEKFNLKRTRLMWVSPYSCYSIHKDHTPRVHIPLVTNPECYFFLKNQELFHMATGYVYWVDTTKEHTFMNCSDQDRLHLVGAVEN